MIKHIGNINTSKLKGYAKNARGENSRCWGVYCDSQKAAKTLALALGGYELPKVEKGGYPHYHDGKHKIHIFFGKQYN